MTLSIGYFSDEITMLLQTVSTCLTIDKWLSNVTPRFLQDKDGTIVESPITKLEFRTPSKRVEAIMRNRRKYGDRAFSVAGPKLCNLLRDEARTCKTVLYCYNYFLFIWILPEKEIRLSKYDNILIIKFEMRWNIILNHKTSQWK